MKHLFSLTRFSLPATLRGSRLRVLAPLALLAAVGPAFGADGGDAFGEALTTITDLAPGVQAIVAVVGFLVALVSLAALRSFAAVLFFLGLAIFGAVGLGIAQNIMGAPLGLI